MASTNNNHIIFLLINKHYKTFKRPAKDCILQVFVFKSNHYIVIVVI
jgi:hypothetical protein